MQAPSTQARPVQSLAPPITAPSWKPLAQAPLPPKSPKDSLQVDAPGPSFSWVHPSSMHPPPQDPEQPNPPAQPYPVPHALDGAVAVSTSEASAAPPKSDSGKQGTASAGSERRQPGAPFLAVYCCVMFTVLMVLTAYLALAIKQVDEINPSHSTGNIPVRLYNDTHDGTVGAREGTEAVEAFTSELSTVDYSEPEAVPRGRRVRGAVTVTSPETSSRRLNKPPH